MRRRAFLAAFLPATAQPDEFGADLSAHLTNVWDLATAYFGCDRDTISTDACKPHRGNLDRRKYEQARQSAKKFFRFTE